MRYSMGFDSSILKKVKKEPHEVENLKRIARFFRIENDFLKSNRLIDLFTELGERGEELLVRTYESTGSSGLIEEVEKEKMDAIIVPQEVRKFLFIPCIVSFGEVICCCKNNRYYLQKLMELSWKGENAFEIYICNKHDVPEIVKIIKDFVLEIPFRSVSDVEKMIKLIKMNVIVMWKACEGKLIEALISKEKDKVLYDILCKFTKSQ